jgi:hypothetical protein
MTRNHKIAAALLVTIACTVYFLRLDSVLGLWVDDGGYAVLGKALATGHGYKLISETNPLDTSFYQPGMPLALAVMWKLFPEFPANVPWLKLVNLLSVAVFGMLAFVYFRKRTGDGAALAIAAGTVLCPSLVFLATSSTMSECLFAGVQFAAMTVVERVASESRYRLPLSALAGCLAGYAYLTRTVGVCVVLAGFLWIIRKRLWREVAVFAACAGILIGGWLYLRHERQKNFTEAQKQEMNYSGFVFERQATTGVRATARDFSDRILQNTVTLAGADMGAIFLPGLLRSPSESGEEQIDTTTVLFSNSKYFKMRDSLGMGTGTMGNNATTIILSFSFSFFVLVGFTRALRTDDRLSEWVFILSFVAVLTYSWTPLRFLVPLLPWLFYYFYRGLLQVMKGWNKTEIVWRIVFAVMIALFTLDHAGYIAEGAMTKREFREGRDWINRYRSAERSAGWVKNNVGKDEVVASGNAHLVSLLTGNTVERCGIEECRARGRRIYVMLHATGEPYAGDVYLFKSGYSNDGVLQLAKGE